MVFCSKKRIACNMERMFHHVPMMQILPDCQLVFVFNNEPKVGSVSLNDPMSDMLHQPPTFKLHIVTVMLEIWKKKMLLIALYNTVRNVFSSRIVPLCRSVSCWDSTYNLRGLPPQCRFGCSVTHGWPLLIQYTKYIYIYIILMTHHPH